MERANAYLKLLLGVIKTITSTLDVDRVFHLIVEKIPEVIGVQAATIRLLDASGKKLVLHAASGLSETYLNRGVVDYEEGVMKALAGTPIAITDATSDTRISHHDAARAEGIRSVLVAPIPIRGKVSGVLRLLTRTRREFTPEEIDFTAAIAEQCGIAIQRAIHHQKSGAS